MRPSHTLVRAVLMTGLASTVLFGACNEQSAPQSGAGTQSAATTTKENKMNSNFSFKDISVRDVESYRGKARFIDVREPHEFNGDLGHIKGAELVPLGTVGGTASSWNVDEPLVIICRSGGRSSRAAEALVQAGFKNVMNMAGGMMAWNSAGLPNER